MSLETYVTQRQHAQVGGFAVGRMARAHSTRPANFDAWELGARACYESVGLEFPEVIYVWSPFELVSVAHAYWREESSLAPSENEDSESVAQQIFRNVFWGELDRWMETLDDEVKDVVLGPISGLVGGAVGDALGRCLQPWRTPLHEAFGDWFNDERAAWIAYFCEVTNIEQDPRVDVDPAEWGKFRSLDLANANACMWWPSSKIVIVCDRPEFMHFEPYIKDNLEPSGRRQLRGLQLHDENAPAIGWRDKATVFYTHGRPTASSIYVPKLLDEDEPPCR